MCHQAPLACQIESIENIFFNYKKVSLNRSLNERTGVTKKQVASYERGDKQTLSTNSKEHSF